MRQTLVNLTDELGSQLVDETGNELVASVQIEDFGMSASNSVLLLHGYAPEGTYTSGLLTYNLTCENTQWVNDNGTMDIQSNKASWKTNGTPAMSISTIDSGVYDCTVSAVLNMGTNNTSNTGIVVRMQDIDNCFIIFITENNFYILRRLSGGVAILANVSLTIAMSIDYVVEVVLSGNTITARLDGANTLTATDSNFNTSTRHGFYGENAGTYDIFQVIQ